MYWLRSSLGINVRNRKAAKFILVYVSAYICVHIHNCFSQTRSNTSEGVQVTWERQVLKTTATLETLRREARRDRLVAVVVFNFSREVTCTTVSAERAVVWSSRKPVGKMSDIEKAARNKQTALIHFCWNIAGKHRWIDVNLSEENNGLVKREDL